MDLETIFTPEEKAALQLLVQRGFEVFTEVRVEDVKELNGTRHRTFRNQGRYDLALMLKHAKGSPKKVVEAIAEKPVEKKAPEKAELPKAVESKAPVKKTGKQPLKSKRRVVKKK